MRLPKGRKWHVKVMWVREGGLVDKAMVRMLVLHAKGVSTFTKSFSREVKKINFSILQHTVDKNDFFVMSNSQYTYQFYIQWIYRRSVIIIKDVKT